jgi:hypothetical protein
MHYLYHQPVEELEDFLTETLHKVDLEAVEEELSEEQDQEKQVMFRQ